MYFRIFVFLYFPFKVVEVLPVYFTVLLIFLYVPFKMLPVYFTVFLYVPFKVVEVLPVGVTAFISLSGLLPNSSTCLPSSSLFKLVSVAIKGTWIKVGHVRDNTQVAQTRIVFLLHFSRLT